MLDWRELPVMLQTPVFLPMSFLLPSPLKCSKQIKWLMIDYNDSFSGICSLCNPKPSKFRVLLTLSWRRPWSDTWLFNSSLCASSQNDWRGKRTPFFTPTCDVSITIETVLWQQPHLLTIRSLGNACSRPLTVSDPQQWARSLTMHELKRRSSNSLQSKGKLRNFRGNKFGPSIAMLKNVNWNDLSADLAETSNTFRGTWYLPYIKSTIKSYN